MNGFGPLSLLFGLILGIAYLAIQSQVLATVSEAVAGQSAGLEYRVETEAAAVEAVEEDPIEIFDANGRVIGAAKAVALLAPERFSRARTAQFITFVDPADLLGEGEAMPEGDLRDLMVEARAARIADQACVRLVSTVAAECGVRGFSTERIARVDERADLEDAARRLPFVDHYLVETEMVFTPKTPVGALPEAPRVTFNEKRFEFEPWDVAGPAPDVMAARADEVMTAATRACADIRAIHGNCGITEIQIDGRYRTPERFTSRFELAWFTPLHGSPVAEEEPVEPSTTPPTAPAE